MVALEGGSMEQAITAAPLDENTLAVAPTAHWSNALNPSPQHPLDQRASIMVEYLMQFPVISEAFDRLKRDLPPHLHFHSVDHATEMMHQAVRLGVRDGLPQRTIELLAIAAAWRDSGYLVSGTHNEHYAATFARDAMIANGYPSESWVEVVIAILDTEKVPGPHGGAFTHRSFSQLSKYLQDAEASYFGREDFFEKILLLLNERCGTNIKDSTECDTPDARKFFKETLRELEQHDWKTEAAKALYQGQLHANKCLLEGFAVPPIV